MLAPTWSEPHGSKRLLCFEEGSWGPGSGPPPAANSLLSAKSIPFPGREEKEEKCSAEKCVSAPSHAPAHTYKFWLTLVLFFKDSFFFVTNKNKNKTKKKVAIFFSVSFS